MSQGRKRGPFRGVPFNGQVTRACGTQPHQDLWAPGRAIRTSEFLTKPTPRRLTFPTGSRPHWLTDLTPRSRQPNLHVTPHVPVARARGSPQQCR